MPDGEWIETSFVPLVQRDYASSSIYTESGSSYRLGTPAPGQDPSPAPTEEELQAAAEKQEWYASRLRFTSDLGEVYLGQRALFS